MSFKIQAKNHRAEILIYEDIGDGWLGGISAKSFVEQLNGLNDITEIDVRINSDGGSVFDGVAIYNALVRHPANVTVHIDGLAASIASVIAMAGDVVNIARGAWLMIHDPWTVAGGTADDLRSQADLLDKIRAQLLDTYVIKTGMDSDKVSALMSAETWIPSDEALSMGFVDNISEDLAIAAHHNIEKYKHAPSVLLNTKNDGNVRDINRDNGAGVISDMKQRLKNRKL